MKRPEPRVRWRLAGGLTAVLAGTALSGRLAGVRSPLWAVALHAGLMRWAVDALPAVQPELRGRHFRVRPWEVALYRRLGVYRYMGVLRRVGWERFRQQAVGFRGGRRDLGRLERATREAETNHALLGLLGLGLGLLAARRRWWDAALWQLLLTVLLHAYPVMLQRSLRARLGPGSRRGPPAAGPASPDPGAPR